MNPINPHTSFISPLKTIIFLLFTFLSIGTANAQQRNILTYTFDGNLKEAAGKGPDLKVLGEMGQFVTTQEGKSAYQFGKNQGLQFNGRERGITFGDSYSIELLFEFDALDSWKRVIDFKNRTEDNGAYMHHGKLNFYNFVTSAEIGIEANTYCHLIVTREGDSRKLRMYAEGTASAEFIDNEGHGLVSSDQVLNFFYDDLKVANEASSGSVVLLRLYDYLLNEEEVATIYKGITEVPEQLVEPEDLIIRGRVLEEGTELPLDAQLEFVATLANGREVTSTYTAVEGKYKLILPAGELLRYSVEAIGYAPVSEQLDIKGKSSLTRDIRLTPVQKGETIVMENILFHHGSAVLEENSRNELKKWVQFLEQHPTLQIEVGGHTDNSGTDAQNERLSLKRAESVQRFLIESGIPFDQVLAKGYGGTQPIASNDAAATRRLNRRVEMKVLGE